MGYARGHRRRACHKSALRCRRLPGLLGYSAVSKSDWKASASYGRCGCFGEPLLLQDLRRWPVPMSERYIGYAHVVLD